MTSSNSKLATFLVSFCLASGIVTSERSIQDSDFSLKAQQVMQAAMRLPPHILPTLDELDGKVKSLKAKNVGVYVPGKSKPVGIYIPKNQGLKKKSKKTSLKLTPDYNSGPRYKRKTKKRQKQNREKIPIFAVALEPESPLGKLYDLSKDQSKKLMTQLSKVRLKKPPSYLKRHQKPFYERERHLFKPSKQHQTSPTPHPYKFEKANFQLPAASERADYGSIRKSTGKNKFRQAQVHKFVPFVVKEALAKSFLKRPERYLQRLYAKQQRKKSRLSPLQRSRRKQQNQVISPDFKVPKVKYSQGEERQKSPTDSLNFDSNFPWEENSASLVKYDSLRSLFGSNEDEKQSTEADEAFKSGEFLGWEPNSNMRRRRKGQEVIEQIPVTKTLCFCCDEEEDQPEEKAVFLSSDFSHRRKRTLKIQDVHQSQQVLKHKEYIHDSLTCLDQDPIEVILVFGPSSTSTTKAPAVLNIPPQLSESFYQNYDLAKLQIHDETQPSPFQRRNSGTLAVDEPNETIEAQLNRLLNSVQNKVETVDAVQLESSLREDGEEAAKVKSSELSEPSRPAAILRQPSKPLVNTLPGYNILRLLTGG